MMRAFLFLLLLSLSGFAGLAFAEERRVGLVVGNSDYPPSVGRLRHPHDDAKLISESLISAGFASDDVEVLLDASREEIHTAALRFADKLRSNDGDVVGFFYYSGHGGSTHFQGRRQNFLIPARQPLTSANQLPLRGVNLADLIDTFEATQAKAVFVVSDACRNDLPWTDTKGGASQDKGFVAEPQRSGMYIVHATPNGGTAPDDGEFARALALQIKQPSQYAPRAFDLAFRQIASTRDSFQRPTASSALKDDICFVSCPGFSGDADPAQIAWDAIKDSTNPEDFSAFVNTYPNHPLAPIASSRILEERALDIAFNLPEINEFKDCSTCPQMLVVPSGKFVMGAVDEERGRAFNTNTAHPRHQVTFPEPFAISKFEITFDQWFICVGAGACKHKPSPPDYKMKTSGRPVVHVSWVDANQFVDWLSDLTGEQYRLPYENEWEYVARAGSVTQRPWGNQFDASKTNVRTAGFAKVGSFPPNAFGVHDMIGSVAEWTADCWSSNYKNAPNTPAPFEKKRCEKRVRRGAAFAFVPQVARSAARKSERQSKRSPYVGFRVARNINQ